MKKHSPLFFPFLLLSAALQPLSAQDPPRLVLTCETRIAQDLPLTLMFGETIDLEVRMLNYTQPLDLSGYAVIFHVQTNRQSQSESYQAPGAPGTRASPAAATEGWMWSRIDVDATIPAAASAPGTRWTLQATAPDGHRVVRAGGPLMLRGTAAASALAPLPVGEADLLRGEIEAAIGQAGTALAQSGTLWRTEWQSADTATLQQAAEQTAGALSAWAATGTVARAENTITAEDALRLIATDTNAWITVEDGTPWLYSVSTSTNTLSATVHAMLVDAFGGIILPGDYLIEGNWVNSSQYEYFGELAGPHAALKVYYGNEGALPPVVPSRWYAIRSNPEFWDHGYWEAPAGHDLPRTLTGTGVPGADDATGSLTLDWHTTTNRIAIATAADVAAEIDDLVQTWFLGTNAYLTVSNSVLTIWRDAAGNGGAATSLWSSAESQGGPAIDPALTNALWGAISTKANKSWGDYAPDGSENPDPEFMVILNRPATMHMSGYTWETYGTYALLTTAGTTAFESGGDGGLRVGPDPDNYFGFTQGGQITIGAKTQGINVVGAGTPEGYAELLYEYHGGPWPVIWFAPGLDVPWDNINAGVVWKDNGDGTATATAPATTQQGYFKATTTFTADNYFITTMPIKAPAGVFGNPSVPPVVYDSTVTITIGDKQYRIPAEEVQ